MMRHSAPAGVLFPALVMLLISGQISGQSNEDSDDRPCTDGPMNSLGPVWVATDLFGIGYERSLSGWFSLGVLACSSGETGFAGARVLLGRKGESIQLRPSLGFCMERREYSSDPGHAKVRWFVWPGLGLSGRLGRFSVSLDFSAASQGVGWEDEGIIVISTALMYMF
jgi:hypothetical protein